MRTILQGYLSREVALKYVPSQMSAKDKTKKIFKNTSFYSCITGKYFSYITIEYIIIITKSMIFSNVFF